MTTDTDNLLLPLEFSISPKSLTNQKRRKWFSIIFMSIAMLPLFGLAILTWLFNKQFNLPIDFFDIFLMLGLPIVPIIAVIVVIRFHKKQLQQMRLQYVVLSEKHLERVTSKSNEVILFDDIKTIKARLNNRKEVATVHLITTKKEFVFIGLEHMEKFFSALNKLVPQAKASKNKVWSLKIIILVFLCIAINVIILWVFQPSQQILALIQIVETLGLGIYFLTRRPISTGINNYGSRKDGIIKLLWGGALLIGSWFLF